MRPLSVPHSHPLCQRKRLFNTKISPSASPYGHRLTYPQTDIFEAAILEALPLTRVPDFSRTHAFNLKRRCLI